MGTQARKAGVPGTKGERRGLKAARRPLLQWLRRCKGTQEHRSAKGTWVPIAVLTRGPEAVATAGKARETIMERGQRGL